MKRFISIILFVLVLSCPVFSFATTDNDSSRGDEPVVTVTPSKSFKQRKILLFPLDIPSYAIRAGTFPLGLTLEYLQKKHYVEDVLDFLSNKEKTFWVYPIIEGGAGTGFGGGLGAVHSNLFHKGYMLRATYRIHINMDQRATFSFGDPHVFSIAGKPVSYLLDTDWSRITSDDYYGIGNNSVQSNHSEFGLDDISIKFGFTYEMVKHLRLNPYIGARFTDTMSGRSSNLPQANVTFPTSSIQGYGRWLDYISFGLGLINDTRNDTFWPDTGGLRSIYLRWRKCLNTQGFSFYQYDLDLRQYIRLFKPRQVLVLRTAWTFQQETGGNVIPFWRMATLDASNFLRGFSRNRFMDRASALINIEYRFPVWSLIDGVAFLDTGRVMHSFSNFKFDDLKYSAGGGVHFQIPHVAFFRFEAAYGGEGVNVLFGASTPL